MSDTPIALIVGLGNPGDEYRNTRHNIGFWFLDALAAAHKVHFSSELKFSGQVARLRLDEGDIWLLKPTTFMNLSGVAVQSLASYYKIPADAIVIVHDELDIVPGCMKMKLGGGNAGHNGLKSITEKLGTPNFWRLRVGIGHPRVFCPQQQVYDWVLGQPSAEHRAAIQTCLDAAIKTVSRLAEGKLESVMRTVSKYATAPKPKKEEKPAQNALSDQEN